MSYRFYTKQEHYVRDYNRSTYYNRIKMIIFYWAWFFAHHEKFMQVWNNLQEFNGTTGGHYQHGSGEIALNLEMVSGISKNQEELENNIITVINHEDIHKAFDEIKMNLDEKQQHWATRKVGYEIEQVKQIKVSKKGLERLRKIVGEEVFKKMAGE